MANAKDITSGNSNILLIGDSGTHKTFFMRGVPGLYVFDFDKGMVINRGHDIEYDTFKDKQRGETVLPFETKEGIYQYGTGWIEFVKKLNEIGQLIEAGKGPKAIALDSLTFMSEIAMNRVLIETGQLAPHQGSYGAQQNYIKTVLGQLTTWPVRLICTAHIQRDKNDMTSNIEMLPFLTGKLAGMVSAYFDEVYFCESETGKDGVQTFRVRTTATQSMRQAKSRWGVPDKTETSFEAVSAYYNNNNPRTAAPVDKPTNGGLPPGVKRG